jgi:hypothetical protein
MRRTGFRLTLAAGATLVFLLTLSSWALADQFPAPGPWNGLSVNYSVSGASLGAPTDAEWYTYSRKVTGKLSGGHLEVSGSVAATTGWTAALSVTVSAGGESKSFTAASPAPPKGLGDAPWSQSFSVGVDVPKGAASASIGILLSGEFNDGGRALQIDIALEGSGPGGGTTVTTAGPAGDKGGAKPTGGKVPGPGSWWKWLAGALVPGVIGGGVSLVGLSGRRGGTMTPVQPRRKYTPPADAPRIGPAAPIPPHPEPPERPPSTYTEAAGKTLVDAGKALGKGMLDFTSGTLKQILTGYEEIGLLGFELTDSSGPSVIKEIRDSPSILWNTPLNIAGEVIEGVNPTEELKALNDPNMSAEGKAWAASSMALKIANALMIKDSLKDLTDSLTSKGAKGPPIPASDLEVAENQSTLWQGEKGQAAAEASGGTPVGKTAGGQAAAERTAGLAWDEARQVWVEISAEYARQAKGVVNCFLEDGLKPETIFSQTELGILLKNPKVSKVNVFVQENGQWVERNWFLPR